MFHLWCSYFTCVWYVVLINWWWWWPTDFNRGPGIFAVPTTVNVYTFIPCSAVIREQSRRLNCVIKYANIRYLLLNCHAFEAVKGAFAELEIQVWAHCQWPWNLGYFGCGKEPFSALTLLVGWQEEHPTAKIQSQQPAKVLLWGPGVTGISFRKRPIKQKLNRNHEGLLVLEELREYFCSDEKFFSVIALYHLLYIVLISLTTRNFTASCDFASRMKTTIMPQTYIAFTVVYFRSSIEIYNLYNYRA